MQVKSTCWSQCLHWAVPKVSLVQGLGEALKLVFCLLLLTGYMSFLGKLWCWACSLFPSNGVWSRSQQIPLPNTRSQAKYCHASETPSGGFLGAGKKQKEFCLRPWEIQLQMANFSIREGACCGCGIFPCCSLIAALFDVHSDHSFLSLPVPLQFSWYTRRAVLTGIYNTTELVMMQDSSPGFEDTWRFLENRVADAMTMSNTASQVTLGTGVHAADPFSPRIYAGTAGFSTMQIPHLLRDPLAAVSSISINGNVFF